MTTTLRAPTELTGRPLLLARLAWLVVTLVHVASFLLSLPLRLAESPQVAVRAFGVTGDQFLAGLSAMNISTELYIGFLQWGDILIGAVYLLLGVFIFWRRSNDWIALLTSFVFITFLGSFDRLAPGSVFWNILASGTSLLGGPLLILWFFVFPDGRFVPRAMFLVFLVVLGTQVWQFVEPVSYGQNFPIAGVIIFGSVLLAQGYRYRRADPAQRQQIKWVVFGIIAGAAPLVVFMLGYLIFLSGSLPVTQAIAFNFFGNLLWTFFLIVLPISITLAILRSRLFDIDVIIRKTLTYALVAALLAAVYLGSVILLQQLFASLTGQRAEAVTVLSTLAIAALFIPLRNRVQSVIDRRFYRKKYNAQQILEDFAQTVRDETNLDNLTGHLLQVVSETMQPRQVGLWLTRDPQRRERG